MAAPPSSPRSSRSRSSRLDIGALLNVDRVTEDLTQQILDRQGLVAVLVVRPDVSGTLYNADQADFISWAGDFEQRLSTADDRLRLAFRSAEEAVGFVPALSSRREIEPLVHRLAQALDGPITLGGADVEVDSRAGLAVVDATNPTMETVLEAAELALRRTSPDHRAQAFRPFQRRQQTHRDRLVARIREDLQAGDVTVRYQPMVDLGTGRVHGVEALARLRDGRRGELSPGVFLPVAARLGLMSAVEASVLTRVADDITRWRDHLHDTLAVWINLSVREVLDDATMAVVDRLLDPHRLLRVGVELTETTRTSSDDLTRACLVLSDRALLTAVDYDRVALTDIARNDIHTVKLSRRVIRHLSARSSDATTALVELLHTMGVSVTAEGIETEGHLRPAVVSGCDAGQGFYFARPAEPAAIDRLLRGAASAPAPVMAGQTST